VIAVNLFMKVSATCPHCRGSRPGERAQIGDHIVTLCYCNSCGVTWTREQEEQPARAPKSRSRRRDTPATPASEPAPAPMDLLLRGSFADGYELVEVATGTRVAAGLSTLEEVLSVARTHGGKIWQQQADRFGRPLGKPIRLTLQAQ
jgi:hypothetical protein